ncbi:TonB-dependent receptor [uncultured Maribacter sp.]|uniref:SusC/RagA family TonB-linked outer membrane protein n=1 Tax=uncultured Maribacter sp. TaxID=431308 RepID=UPI002630E46C|nr:TonB-dependent receptor [uncultured Maribacter sp.]
MKRTILKLFKRHVVPVFLLVVFMSMNSYGQSTITGTITSSDDGTPVPGVNVVVKGTSNGTSTDFDGNYAINASSSDILVFSYLGFKTVEKNVGEQSLINIVLQVDNEQLDEVVVVGYGTQKKSDLTGAVAVVKGAAVNIAPTPNLTQNLSGKLTGVITRQESGRPGGDAGEFLIRGQSTFGDNSALILVDGIERSIDRLDPNTIESITLLKDAASAAIYGARAANGVVLVTTKRGAIGAPTISFNSSIGFQSATNVPDILDAGQFAEFYNEARVNVGDDPIFSEEQVRQYQDGTLPSTNWWDEVIRKSAPVQQYGLTVSGGGEKVRYFTSLGMLDQKGLYETSSFKRYNVRANIDVDLTDRFTFAIDLAGRREKISDSDNEPFGSLLNAQPTSPAYVPDSVEPGGLGYNGVNISPIGEAVRSGYNRTNWNVFQGNLKLNYDIPVEGLSTTFKYSYDHSFRNDKIFNRPYTFYVVDSVNDIYTPFESISNITLKEEYSQIIRETTQFFLNYNREFGKHKIGGLFVFEKVDFSRNNIEAGRQGFISPALDQLLAGGAEGQTSNGGGFEEARLGYIGRFTYSYDDKYLFQANVRHDGSNIFPKNKRWGTFPAFSAAWKISEENFLKDVDFIQTLKIRGSWGKFGNDRVDAFQYLSAYEFRLGSVFGSAFNPGIRDTGVPNPNITWETATDKNLGIDFGFFKGRIFGEFNLFNKRTEDILLPVGDVPDTFGGTLPDTNQAITENKGFELSITYKDKIGKDFNFTISPNITKASNEVIFRAEPEDVPDRIKRTGRPFSQIYGYQDAGLFKTQEDIDNWADQDGQGNASINTGDIKYVDINNDGVIDGEDISRIGKSTIPEIIYGLNLSANYKNLDFSASFQGATDFNSYAYLGAFGLGSNAIEERVVNAYREGNENAIYPRTYFNDPPNNTRTSTFWMIDGSYLKLRNVEIGYTLPQLVLDKLGVSTVRFFVSGNNLLTFSKYDFFDPERPSQGDANVLYYPQLSRVNFGFNVNF